MQVLIVLILIAMTIWYIRRAYLNMKDLSKNIPRRNEKGQYINLENVTTKQNEFEQKIQMQKNVINKLKRQKAQYMTYPPTFSIKRSIKKLNKSIKKAQFELDRLEDESESYHEIIKSSIDNGGYPDEALLTKWSRKKH